MAFPIVLFVMVFCTLWAIPSVESCTCEPPSFNQTMCEAKWVSHVLILKNETTADGLQLNYTVKHLEAFKSPNGTNLVGQNQSVLTPVHSSTCGVNDLQTEEEYLLAGTTDISGNFHINICLFVPPPIEDNADNGNQTQPLEFGYLSWDAVTDELKNRMTQWNETAEC